MKEEEKNIFQTFLLTFFSFEQAHRTCWNTYKQKVSPFQWFGYRQCMDFFNFPYHNKEFLMNYRKVSFAGSFCTELLSLLTMQKNLSLWSENWDLWLESQKQNSLKLVFRQKVFFMALTRKCNWWFHRECLLYCVCFF